jgi:hypothetical protein
MTLEETDIVRHREITTKALSAIILLTLKWFKVSRERLFKLCVSGIPDDCPVWQM